MAQPIEVDQAVARVEALLDEFAEAADQGARARAEELVRVLMEVYGEALERILKFVRETGNGLEDRLLEDKLIGSLLLVHGLHPVDADTRIRRALARFERLLETGSLIIESTGEASVAIRLEGVNGSGAGLAQAIERAVKEAAPEIERVEIEGIAHGGALVQIAPARGA